jgi:PelA/Pel-15E family pectate lyase
MQLDRAALAAELAPGQAQLPAPPSASGSQMPLDREASWYATTEARAIAENIVSFQTPAGGWGKNQNRLAPPRLPGQSYVIGGSGGAPDSANFDTPRDRAWHYVGTIDNGATITEIRFLARIAAHTPGETGARYRDGALRGLNYLLEAQYPNGGWPQVWPLEGGYHDAVTFNDDALSEVAWLLSDAAGGQGDFAFVPIEMRSRAAESYRRAIDVILASQVVIDGRRTIWPQQADPLALTPTSARNYEMPSLASSESAGILRFLMRQPNPSPAIKSAVREGVAWLKAHAIYDQAWKMTPKGRTIVAEPGAGPLWSRYYSLTTGKPIFGDRDRAIYDDVNDVSEERRNGYAWYGGAARQALEDFEAWSAKNP